MSRLTKWTTPAFRDHSDSEVSGAVAHLLLLMVRVTSVMTVTPQLLPHLKIQRKFIIQNM
jgi:hypothetical protein